MTLEALAEAIRGCPHNLMSRRGLEELESRHIPESVALARLLPSGPARLCDVGAGGGLPGLVIALERRDLEVTLVEATRKKADFLVATAERLGVEVEVRNTRVEAAPDLRDRFDLATARAVAPLERLVPWVIPILRPGGRLLAVKGARWRDELEAATAALDGAGAEVVATPDDGAPGGPTSPDRGPLVVTIARTH